MPVPDQTKQEPADVRVLYVAGTGRSGSTLVGNLIGSLAGAVSVGELRYLWARGLAEAAPCGCGEPVAECPLWQAVLAQAYPTQPPDPEAIAEVEQRLLRLRTLPRLLRAHADPTTLGPAATWYAAELASVYRAVHDVTGGAVVVDSSKLVSYGYLLSRAEGLDVRVLHLVRDPRGAAHSWQRVRARDDRGAGAPTMNREGSVKSPVLWDAWNVVAERLWSGDPQRYVRVRYEDVVTDPVGALAPALAMVGLDAGQLPVNRDPRTGAVTAQLAATHSVAGNPLRMTSGEVPLRADLAWVDEMPAAHRAVVTATTAPLLPHYGYPLLAPHLGQRRTAPSDGRATRVFVEDLDGWPRLRARVARNVTWARAEGVRRVLEEKEVDPLRTVPAAVAKWRFRHDPLAPPPGAAMPVFVVGLQRSGTNMVVRGLGMARQVEVHNEDDRRAFERFKLRPDHVVEAVVARSRHTHVLFKPLCDSHRVDHLLDDLPTTTPGRAVWVYRDVDGRVRSALAKFGDGNRQVLREFADGTNVDRWHVQRMSTPTTELVRSFDYDAMSPASGAALMWLVRNQLVLDLALDQRPDVHLVSYREFLAEPQRTMRALCRFLEFPYDPALVRHVTPRPPVHRDPIDVDPRIRELCEDLTAKLEGARLRQDGG